MTSRKGFGVRASGDDDDDDDDGRGEAHIHVRLAGSKQLRLKLRFPLKLGNGYSATIATEHGASHLCEYRLEGISP